MIPILLICIDLKNIVHKPSFVGAKTVKGPSSLKASTRLACSNKSTKVVASSSCKTPAIIEFTTYFHEFPKSESTKNLTNISQLKKKTNSLLVKKGHFFLSLEHLRKSK
jgi:hypothetical protein